jgi:hypothetical protein
VIYVLIILAIPALVVAGVHLLLVLSAARWRPGLARGLAAALLPGMALGFGGLEWARAYPFGVPALAVCGAVYAAMLRLDPRQRLGEVGWMFAVPLGINLLDLVRLLGRLA